ncbi:hypothetical protein ACFLRI_04575 [Bacteroidota bacterium]
MKKNKKKENNSSLTTGMHEMLQSRRNQWIILLILVFILYGNTIQNNYALDDIYVTNNDLVKKGFRAIPEIFTSYYADNVFEDGERLRFGFRPVVKASYAIEYAIFGNNPHMSHFINILLYFLTLLILLRILSNVWSDKSPLFSLLVVNHIQN